MIKNVFEREGLLIAILTFMLYAAVYFYERGVAIALNIPLDAISINVAIISDDFIGFYLFLLPVMSISICLLLWGKGSKLKQSISFLGVITIYMFALYYMSEKNSWMVILINAGVILHLLNQWMPLDTQIDQENKIENKMWECGIKIVNIGAFLFLFAFTFVLLGHGSINKDEYKTFINGGKEYAVVRIYGENVFACLVSQGKIRKEELTYFRMESISGAVLKNKRL
ncbi:hypothetical protein [Aeromonas veronii]|uniref:hypothetical protein n=1 Tax=Aeromonas veronii TaxID=654 RepID=UPI00301CE391